MTKIRRNGERKTYSGCPVVGGANKIMESVEKYKIQKIVIAIPSATSQQIKELVEICKETKCELKILPGIYQLIDGEVSISQLSRSSD